jgi:HSP20 family protein
MSIIKVDPFRGIDSMMRRMNDVFDDINRGGIRFEVGDFTPRVDISETDNAISVHAELPGIDKKDVKITVNDGNILTIAGEKKREEKSENFDKNYMRIERSYGSFARSFTLPDNVAAENINAAFENGVLNITIPKKEPAKPKELEVTIQ